MLRSALVTDPRRAALAIVAAQADALEQKWAFAWLHSQPPEQVVRALAQEQIDQLFLHRAEEKDLVPHLPQRLLELLTARRLLVVANVLRQQQVLDETGELLERSGIAYLVFKGALLRRTLYPDTHLRPSCDLDVLVSPLARDRAMQALVQHGYRLTKPPNTHEASLQRLGVCIDLHWHVMRPGRMRFDWTPELLEQRQRQGGLWGPSETHNTVLTLVHPAITDYVTGRLIRGHDLDLWIRCKSIAWEGIVALLARMGLRTAAWAMLAWTHCLFDTPVPPALWSELAPGVGRQRYLEWWLALQPPEVYARWPHLARAGFSLALQDRAHDAVRAFLVLSQR